MIRREELKDIANLKNLSLRNTEKDYLLELLLFFLSENKHSLVFKGGTALYKFYNLNRFSEDLDFDGTHKKINPDRLNKGIIKKLDLLGMRGTLAEFEEHGNETNFRFMIRGPLYDGRKRSMTRITINLSKRESPISYDRSMLIPSYQEIPSFYLDVLDIREIAAEKVRCILSREKPRDIYDLWFLSKKDVLPEMEMINKKLSVNSLVFDKDEMLEKINEREGMWNRDLKGLVIGSLPTFTSVSHDLETVIMSL